MALNLDKISAATNWDVSKGAVVDTLATVIAIRTGLSVAGTSTVGAASAGSVTSPSASVPCVGGIVLLLS